MRERLAQLARTRVAGVPLPVLFVVLVLIAAVIIHRRRVKAGQAQDASNVDATSSIGAMANGGYAGQDYAFPSTSGTGGTTATDTTGNALNGILNPNAGDVTVTGDPTGTTAHPAIVAPPKVSPAKSAHPAAVHHPAKPPAKKAAKKAAPAKKTTVHRATPTRAAAVHTTKPAAHKPAPHKPPKKHPAPRKPTHRGPVTSGGYRAVLE